MAEEDQHTDISQKTPDELGEGGTAMAAEQESAKEKEETTKAAESAQSSQDAEKSGENASLAGGDDDGLSAEGEGQGVEGEGQGTEIQPNAMTMLISAVMAAFEALGAMAPQEAEIEEKANDLPDQDKQAINNKAEGVEKAAEQEKNSPAQENNKEQAGKDVSPSATGTGDGAEGGDGEGSSESEEKEKGALEKLMGSMGQSGMLAALVMVVMAQFGKGFGQDGDDKGSSVEQEADGQNVDGNEPDAPEQTANLDPDGQEVQNQETKDAEADKEVEDNTRTDGLDVRDKVPAADDLEASGMGEDMGTDEALSEAGVDADAEFADVEAGGADMATEFDGMDLSAMEPGLSESISDLGGVVEEGASVEEASVADLGDMPEPPIPDGATVPTQEIGGGIPGQ